MNLFIGVMFSTYNDAIQKEKKKGIQDDWQAQRYLDYLYLLETAEPEYRTFKKTTNKYSIFFGNIVSNSLFDNSMMTVIVLNMIVMAIDYEGSEPSYSNVLSKLNYFFTSIFILEMILKMIAYGFQGYIYYGWNRFDSFVVISSIVDLVISNLITGASTKFLKSFQIIRVLRILRVTRVLRLFKSLKGLEKILQTVQWSMQALSNVLILLLLIVFIFTILGCNIVSFNQVDFESNFNYYDEYFNFDNFVNGFLLVFRSATGENWPSVMMELAHNFESTGKSGLIIYVFMIAMNFCTSVIMINLFMLVVLQQYDELNSKIENPIVKFNENLLAFKMSWNIYSTEQDEGFRIKNHLFLQFLKALDASEFSISIQKSGDDLKKYVVDLKLIKDKDGYVFFHDALFKIFKKEFGPKGRKVKLIYKEEKKIQQWINNKVSKRINSIKKEKLGISDSLNVFNPLTADLYHKFSFHYLKLVTSKNSYIYKLI